jgi:hypothetical protein
MSSDSGRLLAFIQSAKARNVDDQFLVAILRQNGWSERRIYLAFSVYYEQVLGEPIPSRGGSIEYARDAFSYLIAFIALGCWTVAVGHLFYVVIDRRLPSGVDAVTFTQSLRYQVSTELATIIVAFPIFVVVSRSIAAQLAKRPETADSGVRKWLTYVALIVAAVILIGDAVAFLAGFLQGDLTGRFVLKALVLVVLAGGVFAYYLASVRGEATDLRRDRTFFAAAALAVVAALVFGFFDIGSPGYARSVANDVRRVDDVRDIANRIHGLRNNAAPRSSFTLPRSLSGVPALPAEVDPVTHRPYAYRTMGPTLYELCATFETEDRGSDVFPFGHPAGRYCFTLDAAREY